MAWSDLGAVSTRDAAGPAGGTHAVGEPKRQRQPIGYSNCDSIACRFAEPVAIADWFAYAIAKSDGIAVSVPQLVIDAGADCWLDSGSVAELVLSGH